MITGQPVSGYEQQPSAAAAYPPAVQAPLKEPPSSPSWRDTWRTAYQEADPLAPVQLTFRVDHKGLAHGLSLEQEGLLQREITFQPFAEGVRIWLTMVSREDISGSFCVQQCLRFTGQYNAPWRQSIAHVPFLSELDMQAMGNPNGTLAYTRVEHQRFLLPVQYCLYPSKTASTALERMPAELLDHGLIMWETASRQIAPPEYWAQVAPQAAWEQVTCGMYW
jgi:hypothetical protein